MCARQLVNVFGVLLRECTCDNVWIVVRSALRTFCRRYRVVYPPLELQSIGFLRVHACKLVFCIHFKYHSTCGKHLLARCIVVRDPTPIALWGVVPMFFVLISNRWALDFSVLL